MEIIKLIGVAVVIVGLILKFDTLATVVVAGILTGIVSGMSILDIFTVLGEAFLKNRVATLFILTLPAIGISERFGLKNKAVDSLKKIKNATTGRLVAIYFVIRTLAAAFSIRIGGHAQFIRPLINPMAYAAAKAKYADATEKEEDDIKGLCAAVENVGNFFAQNCFMGAAGTLLIVSTLTEQGFEVDALGIAMWSVPAAISAVVVGVIYCLLFDAKLDKDHATK